MTTIKCVVVGDGTVGKTCLLMTYTQNKFPEEYVPTVFENHASSLTVEGRPYTLNLFDTAGQEEYDRLRPLAYPGTEIFLVCFDTFSQVSLKNVEQKWIEEINHYCPKTPFILVGTKTDLRDNPRAAQISAKHSDGYVSREEGQAAAQRLKAVAYMECSALRRTGLNEIFDQAVQIVVKGITPQKKSKSKKCEIL